MKKKLAILTVVLFSSAFLSVLTGIIEVLIMAIFSEVPVGGDPNEMARMISEELVSAALVLILSPFLATIGAILLFVNKYRARWYFWCSLIFTLPYSIFFPFGTATFVAVWVFLLLKRNEFDSNLELNNAT